MKFLPTRIPDVIVIEPLVLGDERGFFAETWRADRFATRGLPTTFVQDNHSRSARGVLRGLHFQLERPQGKLVRVASGSVFDVAVDVRRSSPTFGKWVGEELSAENRRQLWIPPGFAHGFLVLSAAADFVYKCTDYYHPDSERTLLWNDPEVAISWPIPSDLEVRLSARDTSGALISDLESFA